MGGGRDKRKKAAERKDGPIPGKGTVKTATKTAKNEGKAERRTDRALAGDEDDIDALLAKIALADKAQTAVTIDHDCSPPSARVSASVTAHITPVGVTHTCPHPGTCVVCRPPSGHVLSPSSTHHACHRFVTPIRANPPQ